MILLKLLAIAEIFIGTVNSENSTENANLFTTINGRDAEEGEYTEDDNLFTTINVRDAEEGEFTEDDNLFTTINGRDAEEGEFAEDDDFRRIINGQTAKEGQFPYQVLFQLNGEFTCSGTLIDKYHVLTVARRFTRVDRRNITVVGGVLYKYDYDNPHSFVRECSKLYLHEHYNYDHSDSKNDIAICRLYGGLRHYTKFVQPIALNRNKTREEKCILAGWGRVTRRKRMFDPSEVGQNYPLQFTKPTILPINKCKTFMRVKPGAICTGPGEGNAHICYGEAGDGLVCNGKLTGITTYHYHCRMNNHVSFYTEIYYYIPWIEDKLRKSYQEIEKFS